MALQKRRKYLAIGTQPRQILLRLPPELFHRLRQRAKANKRSLNFECNEIIRSALEKTKGATYSS